VVLLPAVKYRPGAPPITISGLHPRAPRPEPSSAFDEIDDLDPSSVFEQKLADTRAELEATRRERDALAERLGTVLRELSALKDEVVKRAAASAITVPPPVPLEDAGDWPEATLLDSESVVSAAEPVELASESAEVEVEPAELEAESVGLAQTVLASAPVLRTPPLVRAPEPMAEPAAPPVVAGELSRVVVSPCPPSEDESRPSSAERRRRERHACEFEVEFLSDTHFTTGITQDLSEGGVFVATYQRLPIGTKVELAFELPGEQRVDVEGEVRWIREERGETRPGLGIAFRSLSLEALSRITAYCVGTPSRYYEL
jgi:uncharacterized protein (TIGR02266 family)